MQVIKHGNTYKEIECPKCNAWLSYCDSDIESRCDMGNYHGQLYTISKEWIVCPECYEKIVLKSLTS